MRHGLRLWLVLCATVAAAQEPVLVTNAGHQGTISAIAFSPDGKFLVTAGRDKVVRLWDVSTGRMVRDIRGQIGEGSHGAIYAMAISPDGRWLAVGGYLAGSSKREWCAVRVHDFKSGEVQALLQGVHTEPVTALAFSLADPRLLASGANDAKVVLWNVEEKRKLREYKDHTNFIHAVAFSPDGSRIVSASADKTLRVWRTSGGHVHILKGHTGAAVTASFSPDGRWIVSGATDPDREIRFWNAETGTLVKPLPAGNGELANISVRKVPPGGSVLFCRGDTRQQSCQIALLPGGQTAFHFRRHQSMVQATAISSDGLVAATAGSADSELFLWRTTTGDLIHHLGRYSANGLIPYAVGFGRDGRSIAFGVEQRAGGGPNQYGILQRVFYLDSVAKLLGTGPAIASAAGYLSAREEVISEGTQLSLRLAAGDKWEGQVLQVLRGGAVHQRITRNETSGYRHTAFTFSHDGRFVISGGQNGFLESFEAATGHRVNQFVGHGDTAILSVAVSEDNRLLASSAEDRTIRLWDIARGRNLLNLFLLDDEEWIVWTQEGYYACSVNGARYVGWHLNRGVERAARLVEAAELEGTFHRPDVIFELLASRDIATAVASANKGRGITQGVLQASDVTAILPPQISLEPGPAGQVWQLTARVSSDLPIRFVQVYHNGVLVRPEQIDRSEKSSGEQELRIRISAVTGLNTVYVTAANTKSRSRGKEASETLPGTKEQWGNLHILAAAIDKYDSNYPPLQFPVKDAKSVLERLSGQKNGLFRDVKVHELYNQSASSENILSKIDQIKESMQEGDGLMVYLSGHGAVERTYHFVGPSGNLNKDGLPLSRLLEKMMKGPNNEERSRTVLIIDTCQSGHSKSISMAGFQWPDQQEDEGGLVLLAASDQNADESNLWGGGAFTQALLEILSGPSNDPENPGEIYTDELAWRIRLGIRKRAPLQSPVVAVLPAGMSALKLFKLPVRR